MKNNLALVVDDESDQRTLLRRVLEREGYVVVEAEDGIEGLSVLSEVQPALVVLDLEMPKATGWEFLRERAAREIAPSAKVIVCSGRDTAEAPVEHLFCHKPVSAETFRLLVHSLTYLEVADRPS